MIDIILMGVLGNAIHRQVKASESMARHIESIADRQQDYDFYVKIGYNHLNNFCTSREQAYVAGKKIWDRHHERVDRSWESHYQ